MLFRPACRQWSIILQFFKGFFPVLKIFIRKKIRNESVPLPDPPSFRVKGYLGIVTSQIPQEIKVFLAPILRGVGQGQTVKIFCGTKLFGRFSGLLKGSGDLIELLRTLSRHLSD
jgi:hypothetical protein